MDRFTLVYLVRPHNCHPERGVSQRCSVGHASTRMTAGRARRGGRREVGDVLAAVNAIDEAIYAKHAYELMRFATTLVGPSGAEDVVADAVLRAMTSPSWPTVTEHRAYLFRAVANEASSMRRSAGRRRARERRVASADRIEAQPIDPDVTAAMSRLSVRERSVLYLAYWLDLPVTEIAESLHLSARTTERALHTARATLEEHLR